MARLEDVPLELVMELARVKITIRDLLGLAPGSMLNLPAADCDSVRVRVGQLCIAKGEIASQDHCYSVRVLEITEDADFSGERS
jgi:flagellar motor switch protein FliN/FliY